MSTRQRLLLWSFALLGLGASSASAWVHYRLLDDPTYTSFCDVSSTVNCTQAYLSPYGSFLGVPVAAFGVLFFAGLAGLLAAERLARTETASSVPGYVFAASTAGLAVSLYLAYGAFVVLKAVCLLCVLTYVAVVGLFLVSAAATPFPMTTLPRRALRDLGVALRSPLALAVSAVLLAGAVSALAFFPRERVAAGSSAGSGGAAPEAAAPAVSAQQQSELERWFEGQPRSIVPVDPAGARVLIVKFNDYQCPPCRKSYEDYKPILARYEAQQPGTVKLVTRDFPLDPECNAGTPAGGHLAACEAAVAARLAHERGKGAAMEDWLYANQATLTPAGVRVAAREVAGITDFDARYAKVLEQVRSDTALGGLLNVRATPTFFINGVKIDGGLAPQYFDAIVAYELKKTAR